MPLIEEAAPADVPRVAAIMERCKQQMVAAGIDQWDAVYPTEAHVSEDFNSGCLFVARKDGVCVGAVCLNCRQAEEYAGLNWQDRSGTALVIHRLCVDPSCQQKGVASAIMDFAETFAAAHGFSSIRLDTYTGNPRALALYERRGYVRVGQVRFPRRRWLFDCFEKLIPIAGQP